MAKAHVTLSRAHKIAERIKQKLNELTQQACASAQSQSVAGTAGAQQALRLIAQGQDAMEKLEQSDKLSGELASLRAQIGRQNEARGISAMLAKVEDLNRRLAVRRKMLGAKGPTLTPQDLNTYTPLVPDNRFGNTVQVAVLTAADFDNLEEQVATLQREVFQLTDEIAEANAARFEIELDDALLSEVTGL